MPNNFIVSEEASLKLGAYRLSARKGELIDRSTQISFFFDGRSYNAYQGDSIASALAAEGVQILSRSFKYHRPRGLLCCSGHCPNCLVQVGDEPNVRACKRLVKAGMKVSPQNAWPSLKWDLMSLVQLVSRLMPVGFYYKTFLRPRSFWPYYEKILRRMAGLGEVKPNVPLGKLDKQFLHADVTVVGSGPSGMAAAMTAAEKGARVLLFDENLMVGGHLRYLASGTNESSLLFDLRTGLDRHPNLKVFTETTVCGWYQDNWLLAVNERRLFKIRTRSMVIATGAYDAPLLFENNDLPGVMLGGGLKRLLHLFRVVPGNRVMIVTANDDGWALAADLHSEGVKVVAIVDERETCGSQNKKTLFASGIPIFFRHTILSARGPGVVRRAEIIPIDIDGVVDHKFSQSIDCDLIAICVGWTPATDLLYMAKGGDKKPEENTEVVSETTSLGIYVVGKAAGTQVLEAQIAEGKLAGSKAAAYVGLGTAPVDPDEGFILADRKTTKEFQNYVRGNVPGKGKRFLCFCEDVTDQDLEDAIEEGYDSIELLKRYSTISMGPCQGKMCSEKTIHLCAHANGLTVQETGKTTSRPPIQPVTLGSLTGQKMEPVQVTAVQSWHLDNGAKMMVAGLWLRPEHYGKPEAEVKAVREGVGLIDVSPLGKLRLLGPGVIRLIERLYVNSWDKLGLGRVGYGVMSNDEGVVLDDGVCAHLKKDEWYINTTSTGASGAFEWIQWWMQSGWGEGVLVADLTDTFSAFNLAGPQSRAVLQELTSQDLSNQKFPYMCIRLVEVAGVMCRVLRIGFTGELSYEIHCPSGYAMHLWEALMDVGKEFRISPVGVEAQRVLRLEKAHLIVGYDTDALSDPISANLAWTVKPDKEDFLGKRALVRISNGGVKQQLVGFRMMDPNVVPDEGLQIVKRGKANRKEIVGWISSSRYSPTLKQAIGLCWLRDDIAVEKENIINVYMEGKLEEACVHHGAFYDPQGERLRM